jgi:hypothetical protein
MRFSCAADCCAAAEPSNAGNADIKSRQSERNENVLTGRIALPLCWNTPAQIQLAAN